jgi:hypothetical protein
LDFNQVKHEKNYILSNITIYNRLPQSDSAQNGDIGQGGSLAVFAIKGIYTVSTK